MNQQDYKIDVDSYEDIPNGWDVSVILLEDEMEPNRIVMRDEMLRHLEADSSDRIETSVDNYDALGNLHTVDKHITLDEWIEGNGRIVLQQQLGIIINAREGRTITSKELLYATDFSDAPPFPDANPIGKEQYQLLTENNNHFLSALQKAS